MVINAVVVAAGGDGEFVLEVRVADHPHVVEVRRTVAVSVRAAVFVNGGGASCPRAIVHVVINAIAIRIRSLTRKAGERQKEEESQQNCSMFSSRKRGAGISHAAGFFFHIKCFLQKCSNKTCRHTK